MIKKLVGEQEFTKFVDIVAGAYPGVMGNSATEKDKLKQFFMDKQDNDPAVEYYGLFRDEHLIAGMRLHYYEMNLFSKMIPIGGVGLVAVDLLHKKEGAAKELIDQFLHIYLENDVHFVALYPFRPDFYKMMGFGYGPKIYQYVVEPTSFPKGPSKSHLLNVDKQEKEQLAVCYKRVVEKQHGMFYKTEGELEGLFKNPDNRIVAFQKEGQIRGYIVFAFKKQSEANFMLNNMIIKEFVYETPEALLELSTFIHSQADQVNRVEWNTHDDNAYFLLGDARNGSDHLIPSVYHASAVTGIGLMYRIIDVRGFFKDYCPRQVNTDNVACKLTVHDSFLPANSQQIILKVTDGFLQICDNETYDVEMKIDISELSSLVMGVVTVRELYMFSRVEISDEKFIKVLNQLFYTAEKPVCMTAF